MAKPKLTTDGLGSSSQKTAQPLPSPLPLANEPTGDWSFAPLRQRLPRPLRWAGWAVLFLVGLLVVTSIVYAGKAYPGVSANGTSISGLSRSDAIAAVKRHLADYQEQLIPINYENSTAMVSPAKLEVVYDVPGAVDAALAYGHTGSLADQLYQQARALAGRPTAVAAYTFNEAKLTPYLSQLDSTVFDPAANASLNFSGNSVTVNPAKSGHRLNTGWLVLQIKQRLASSSADVITAPIAEVMPTIDTASLEAARAQASTYVAGPINLRNGTSKTVVPQDQIVSWIQINRPSAKNFDQTQNVSDYYTSSLPVTLSLDETAVASFVKNLAAKIDQDGQNAALNIQDGKVTVFQPSHNGQLLDQAATIQAIKASLEQMDQPRDVDLAIKVTKPDVREENLNDLGIKELISEGETFFPGSIPDRITNIKVGAAKFNGILVKPGAVFSFDDVVGDIDAAHGYKPGLAIVGNKIEPQYGGGICQVSSTAYRAALLAGLPILERVNHAYAVGFYTAPYGVPGVDATIYSPQVDLRFRNDTSSYILIQTVISGTSLKFDFYGTKTKTGQIRGPFFVDGTNDETKPSTTTFYRDVLDLSGKVTKTDTVTTHYASSLDFTHVKTPGFD